MQNYKKYKKLYEKDQQTIKPFDKLYKKFLKNNVIDKSQFESLCNIFIKYIDEIKNESFL